MKKKTQPKNTKKRTKAGENGFSYKLEALGIVYAALGLFMAVSLWYPEVGFLGDSAHYFLTMGLGLKSCQNHYLSVAASLEAPSCLFSQRLQAVLGPLFCSLP